MSSLSKRAAKVAVSTGFVGGTLLLASSINPPVDPRALAWASFAFLMIAAVFAGIAIRTR